MRSWLILPVMALTVAGAVALGVAGTPSDVASAPLAPLETKIAAIQEPVTLTDACVWKPEAAAAGMADPCAVETAAAQAIEATRPSGKALVWPDDFIELTAQAAADVYDAAAELLADIYAFAFESEEAAKKADS